jgi:murein DD-endopeptidase MepM/ murein hydrolase activator NlpD
MSKISFNKITICANIICSVLIVLSLCNKAYADDVKFFKITRAENDARVLKMSTESPFKNLRNYKSVSRTTDEKTFYNTGFTKDRDFRNIASINLPHAHNTINRLPEEILWPISSNINQRLTSPFGYRIHPVTGKRSFHEGIDISAAIGTAVRSTHNGVVTEVKNHRELGKYVKVTHSQQEYALYGHLSDWDVKVGDRVSSGEIIGKVGTTGRSTGPHLHYTLKRNNKTINPLTVLKPPASAQAIRVSSIK